MEKNAKQHNKQTIKQTNKPYPDTFVKLSFPYDMTYIINLVCFHEYDDICNKKRQLFSGVI